MNGKSAVCVSPGPFNRPETESLGELFSRRVPEEYSGNDTAVFITDCSTLERIGELKEPLESYPIAVIDHHSSGEQFGDARYVVPKAAATTMLIHRLFLERRIVPDPQTAEYLLFGLATDTGFFRHTGAGAAEVFTITAQLVEAGASPNAIHRKIFGFRTVESRQLLGTLLSRTEEYYNGKLLVTYQTLADIERFGKINKDSDTLYMLLQGIKDVEVVVLVREETAEECSVGLRSNNGVDVGIIAQQNGGGGHKKAAGFTKAGSRDVICNEIVTRFREILSHL
jgi:phosphoesterase RecJ-like protein